MTDRLLKMREVCERVGLSRATIYRLEGRGQFPPRVHVTECAIRWRENEVASWIAARAPANDNSTWG